MGMGSRFADEDIDDDVGDYYDDYVDDVDDVGIVFNSPSLRIMVEDITPFWSVSSTVLQVSMVIMALTDHQQNCLHDDDGQLSQHDLVASGQNGPCFGREIPFAHAQFNTFLGFGDHKHKQSAT